MDTMCVANDPLLAVAWWVILNSLDLVGFLSDMARPYYEDFYLHAAPSSYRSFSSNNLPISRRSLADETKVGFS